MLLKKNFQPIARSGRKKNAQCMKIANWSKEIIIVPGLKLQKDDDLLSLLRGYTLEHTQCYKQMLLR
jgi:hypothetical protein